MITGSSSDLAAGSNVTLTINGQTYVAAVLADGSWSVGVPAADVSAWPAGTVTITASGNTTAGNPVSVNASGDCRSHCGGGQPSTPLLPMT
ncbi:adhesin for cattle intestine colonization [Escherichia coli]|uniref:Adhesin for cattle intestine colonization n=1 Tax=Escherichia coli TaxID=562 RepID=A0A376VPT6_ECOLX|nr:adhesin for cattle intestine colonization [Escherichia coli]